MKRSLLFCIILSCMTMGLFAQPYLAVKFRSGDLQAREEISNLNKNGIDIYYYNDDYILAGIDQDKVDGFELIQSPGSGEKLYLISKDQPLDHHKLRDNGRILRDLGSDLLYTSSQSELELIPLLKIRLLPLRLEPIVIPATHMKETAFRETQGEIAQLVNQVSADSVLYFIQSLQDLGTRYAMADNRYEVSLWIMNTFARFGISAQLQEFNYQGTIQYNVVAEIPGISYPDEYIVVGGHHDSITYNTPETFAPGADDNASGTTAVLEIARVLAANNYQPKCSIRFVTYAAEEFGLHGSNYDASLSYTHGDNIRLMINHDMIANNNSGTSTVRLMPYDGCNEQTAHAQYLTSTYTDLEAFYGTPNSHSSDSYSYWTRGYPVIYFFETDFSPYYHGDNDIVANIDQEYCAEVIKASLASTVSFANMPAAVHNFVVEDIGDGSSLRASWDMPNNPDIDHFCLYYGLSDPTLEEPIMVYDQDYYVVSSLTEGEVYNFALTTSDIMGNESNFVYASQSPLSQPRIPQQFVAQPVRDGIKLTWEANNELDLAGYMLWRADDSGDQYQLLNSEPITDLEFLDEAVIGAVEQVYSYRLQAIDTQGFVSELSSIQNSRPASLDNGIVLVDATMGGSGANVLSPTDQQVTDYYDSILEDFDHQTIDLQAMNRNIRLYDISIFSTVIWHDVDSVVHVLPEENLAVMEDYIALGGKLIYNGYMPSKALMGNAGYPTTFAEDSFINRVFGVLAVDYSPQALMNTALSLQSDLNDMHVGQHASLEGLNYHIMKVEGMSPTSSAQKYYSYGTAYPPESPYSFLARTGVGIYSQYQEGQSLLFTFPLYVIEEEDARQMLYNLLHLKWGETVSLDDLNAPPMVGFSLLPNYPNPFQQSTSIRLEGAKQDSPVSMRIYNLRGQLIRELYHGLPLEEYRWDGLDYAGRDVSSGVYFIRAKQKGHTAFRKIICIK
nr:hypothetical protein [Candidatus Cloacimonadota bacterium]